MVPLILTALNGAATIVMVNQIVRLGNGPEGATVHLTDGHSVLVKEGVSEVLAKARAAQCEEALHLSQSMTAFLAANKATAAATSGPGVPQA